MLLFRPSASLPFWKLCTMGVSDCRLPLTCCSRSEFILFLPEEISGRELLSWYCDVLLSAALYPVKNRLALSPGHSILWGQQPAAEFFSWLGPSEGRPHFLSERYRSAAF